MSYYDQVSEAAEFVRQRIAAIPETAIVLGSGLGDFADRCVERRLSSPTPTSRTGRRRSSSGTPESWSWGRCAESGWRCSPAARTTTRGTR